MKTWFVLGAGAIGGLWALRLHRANLPVTLVGHGSHYAMRTLSVEDNRSRWHATFAEYPPADIPPHTIQRLLICTKAQDTLAAITPLWPALAPNACLQLLQNGMGVREELLAAQPGLRLFSATTTDGVYRINRDELVLAGRGETLMGSPDPALQPLCRAVAQELIQLGLPIAFSPAIEQQLWQKLAINCAINPLTVYFACRNGELLAEPKAQDLMQQVCAEIAALMQARGMKQSADSLLQMATGVAARTAANTSSMLADMRAHRPTEIAYMNGFVVREADALGLPCPANRMLLDTVLAAQA